MAAPLNDLGAYDRVVIIMDQTDYDYVRIENEAQLFVDTRSATHGIESSNIFRCSSFDCSNFSIPTLANSRNTQVAEIIDEARYS